MNQPHSSPLSTASSHSRQLVFGFVLHGVGAGWGDWRHANAVVDASVNFGFYKEQAQLAEKARFDFLLIRHGLLQSPDAVQLEPVEGLRHLSPSKVYE